MEISRRWGKEWMDLPHETSRIDQTDYIVYHHTFCYQGKIWIPAMFSHWETLFWPKKCLIWNTGFLRVFGCSVGNLPSGSPSLRNSSCPLWLAGAIRLSTVCTLGYGLRKSSMWCNFLPTDINFRKLRTTYHSELPVFWTPKPDIPKTCEHSARTSFVDENSSPWFPVLYSPIHCPSLSKLHRKKKCQLWHASRNLEELFRKEIWSIFNANI